MSAMNTEDRAYTKALWSVRVSAKGTWEFLGERWAERGQGQATRKASSTNGEWWVGRGLHEPCALMESIRVKLPPGESTSEQVGSPEQKVGSCRGPEKD